MTKSRPSKLYFYYLFYKQIQSLGKIDSITDYACGEMSILNHINPKTYFGVDVLKDRIDKGLKTFSQAEGFTCRIQDYKIQKKTQLVVCLQTIGINSWFENDESIEVIKKLISSTNSNGSLLFNIGPKVNEEIGEFIYDQLEKEFSIVERMVYGRFSKKYNGLISNILFQLMKLFPSINYSSEKWIFFICKEKY